MSGSSCIWKLGEAIVEEILKGRRLGARGFAWIRVSLLLGRSFEVLSRSWAVTHIDSSFLEWVRGLACGILGMKDRSEVATSDLVGRRSRVH